jgi:hypothetical protein
VRNFEAGRAGGAVIRIDLNVVPAECRTEINALDTPLPDVYVSADAAIRLFQVEKEL